MTAIFVSWAISFAVLAGLAVLLSRAMRPVIFPLGILIDTRGRYSLTHFQLVVWTLAIVSLISGVFFGRLWDGVANPLGFTIPGQVLGLLGISVASAVTATAIKVTKDATSSASIAASGQADPARLAQIFLQEEGDYADKVIDITKFQNFAFTLVLVVAYVFLTIHAISQAKTASAFTGLPTLSGTFLILVGISQAGYVGGKLAPRTGVPAGMTMANRTVRPTALRAAEPTGSRPRPAPAGQPAAHDRAPRPRDSPSHARARQQHELVRSRGGRRPRA